MDAFLVPWVPIEFVEIVGRGIRANPVEAIRWLDDVDPELTHALRRAHGHVVRSKRP